MNDLLSAILGRWLVLLRCSVHRGFHLVRCFICSGILYGEVEGLVFVERWSCSRGASCVVKYTVGRLRDWSL